MKEKLFAAALLLAGVVHLLPAAGVLGAPALQRLYGIDASEPTLALLLRHRAVLFGVLGAWMVCAAFVAPLRWWAWAAALLSMGAFVVLATEHPALSEALQRVVWLDIALCVLLAAAGFVRAMAAP